jgi:FkbM family methyltransferase
MSLISKRHGPIWYRNRQEDLDAINTVIAFDAYRVAPDLSGCKAVLDLGANIGIATLYFSERLPEAQIRAVEPSLANCRVFEKNLESEITSGRVQLVRCAAGVEDADGLFAIGDDIRYDSFSVRQAGADSASEIATYESVPIRSVTSLLDGLARPLIVKIDIEGAEEELLRARERWIHLADCLMIEFHSHQSEKTWTSMLTREGWQARKHFDTWHFTRGLTGSI